MKVVTFLCARDFVIDQFTNMVSGYGLHELIPSPSFPRLLTQFTVLTSVRKEKKDKDVVKTKVTISLNGKPLFSGDITFEFKGAELARHVLRLDALPLMQPGTLSCGHDPW